MAVYRVEKTHDYTVMANHHLRDERLSLKAKGLLSMLLSLPDDWEISIRGLASIVTDGVGAVQTGINELIEAGYIVRRRQHADTGAFAGFEYIIHEVPPCTENPYTANPYTGKPYTENPAQSSKDKLSTIPLIVPHEGKDSLSLAALTPPPPSLPPAAASLPAGESLPLLGEARGDRGDDNPSVSGAAADSSLCTREPLGGDVSELDTPPKRKRRRSSKSVPDYEPELFERFWAAYPRGEDRQGAVAEWDSLRPDRETMLAMSRALVRQKASEEWQRGIGIPYAVRWLRRRRWEDEIKAPAPPPERAGGDLPVWN